jgi:hypothetical protein
MKRILFTALGAFLIGLSAGTTLFPSLAQNTHARVQMPAVDSGTPRYTPTQSDFEIMQGDVATLKKEVAQLKNETIDLSNYVNALQVRYETHHHRVLVQTRIRARQ